ncbi:S8 family serine peptidase [Luteococcus sanguinis]|uniref:S8 family serine peptidase n=1 Tax=Luteococcus sanguinis TaxID=174038 RepID=A0ABW1X2W2_9ACTN
MNHRTGRPVRGFGCGLAALAMIAGVSLAPAHAAPTSAADLGKLSDYITQVKADGKGATIVPDRYFVAVAGNPTARGGSAADVKSRQAAVKQASKAKGLDVTVTSSYDSLWNGLAVRTSEADAIQLQAIDGVTGVFPIVAIDKPVTSSTAKPDMFTAGNLTGVNIAQSELGYTGKGIKVGVIDSGIDIDHPDLGGTGTSGTTAFPNAKVAGGYDFVGDAYDAETNPVPVPDPIPDDCGGHGTHVSGIIAGQGDPAKNGVRGVAPDATLYGYRVFGCEGSVDTEIIMQALQKAGDDRVDVVNMSLGASFMSWPNYPDAVASDNLAARGTIVVASAGNEGEYGGMAVGSPSVGSKTISVGSVDNTMNTAWGFSVNGKPIGYAPAEGAAEAPTSGTMPIVVGDPLNGCLTMSPVPAGSAVLVQRGECSFRDKALAAQAAGASALVIYNNQPGVISPTVAGDPAISIPVVMITKTDGDGLKATIDANGPQTIDWARVVVSSESETAGLASDFTSWGLAADLSLKPDVAAPGGNIWSTVPLEQGAYGSKSGTSMAAPHTAGAVALLLQGRPELKGDWEAVRNLLQNTADEERPWSFAPSLSVQEMVTREGAGLIQIDRAILSKQSAAPGKISLGDADMAPASTKVTVRNDSDEQVTYSLSNLTGVGFVGNSNPEFDLLDAQVTMPATLTVPAHGTASFGAAISAPAGAPSGYQYGGWLQLKADNAQELSIPYAGMAGNYQDQQILADAADGTPLPSLARTVGGEVQLIGKQQARPLFKMKGDDVPIVVFHMEYPAAALKLDVYAANADGTKGARLGTAFSDGVNGRDTSYVTLAWDGSFIDSKVKKNGKTSVKAGTYILELKALKALADPAQASSWEVYDTQAFSVKSAHASTNQTRFDKVVSGPLS